MRPIPIRLGAAIAAAAIAAPASAQVSRIPGTIIGVNNSPRELVQYDASGQMLGVQPLMSNFSNFIGLALIDHTLYVGDVNGRVGTASLATGNVTPAFDTGIGSIEALQSFGGRLLQGSWSTDAVNIFNPDGSAAGAFPGGFFGFTGVDTDGTRVFRADYLNSDRIVVSNNAGAFLYEFSTGLGQFSLSALAYDAATDRLWTTSGFGTGAIAAYDAATGASVTAFPSGAAWINGLEVVPPPEDSIIGIDLEDTSGGTNSPPNWNTFAISTPGTIGGLVSEAGNPGAATFTLLNGTPFPTTPIPATIPQHTVPLAGLDGYYFGVGAGSASLGGLLPGKEYYVWVFGLRGFTMNNRVTVAGGTATVQFDQPGTAGQLFVNSEIGDSARNLQSYAVVQTATPGGMINFGFEITPGGQPGWTIAGLAAKPVPHLIGIDFDTDAGSPMSPANWNTITQMAPLAVGNLIDELGNVTGVGLTLTNGQSFQTDANPGSVPQHLPALPDVGNYFWDTTLAGVILDGLTPSADYDLWVFGLRGFPLSNRVTITGAGDPVVFDQVGGVGQLFVNAEPGSSTRPLENYAVSQRAAPDGTIALRFEGTGDGFWAIAGLALRESVTADTCLPDLAPPFGTLDIFDVLAFLELFDQQDPRADFAPPFGTFDIFDVLAFLELFDEGCP